MGVERRDLYDGRGVQDFFECWFVTADRNPFAEAEMGKRASWAARPSAEMTVLIRIQKSAHRGRTFCTAVRLFGKPPHRETTAPGPGPTVV